MAHTMITLEVAKTRNLIYQKLLKRVKLLQEIATVLSVMIQADFTGDELK